MGRWIFALCACAVVAVLAGCSGVSSSSTPTTTPATAEAPQSTSITVASTIDSPSLDPAWSYSPTGDSLLGLTNDGLVGFRHVGGRPGATLVPDLATAMPTSTDGGRTWTATIRQGIHYSTGQAVQPSDVRRAIERDFALGSQGLFALSTIVGAAACDSAPATCSLADGIQTNDLTGEITFNLTRPNAEFPFILALPLTYPLPPGTPTTWATTQASAGHRPVRGVVLSARQAAILSRNPQFHVWSPDAQPAGVADHIVFTLGMSGQDALHAVAQGDAVTAVDAGLRSDHLEGATVVALPPRSTGMLTLNTRVAPFTSVLARRAFALAIDRNAMVTQLNGAGLLRPGCRLLLARVPRLPAGVSPPGPHPRAVAGARIGDAGHAGDGRGALPGAPAGDRPGADARRARLPRPLRARRGEDVRRPAEPQPGHRPDVDSGLPLPGERLRRGAGLRCVPAWGAPTTRT